MRKPNWRCFLRKLNYQMVERRLADKPAPVLTWISFRQGVGYLFPVTLQDTILCQEIVSVITVSGQPFRAWGRGEFGDASPVSMQIPSACGDLTLAMITGGLEVYNGLPRGSFTSARLHTLSRGERLLRATLPTAIVPLVEERDGVLTLGFSPVYVYRMGTLLSRPAPPTAPLPLLLLSPRFLPLNPSFLPSPLSPLLKPRSSPSNPGSPSSASGRPLPNPAPPRPRPRHPSPPHQQPLAR